MICLVNMHWVIPIKDKKGVSIVDAFLEILKEFNPKPNKVWVDKGREFLNNSFKKWLKDNYIEMYSIHNKGNLVVAERFIRKRKSKIFKQMTAISKNVYFDVLDDIVNKYNNTVHRTITMKRVDVKDNTYVDSKKELNDKDPKCKVGDHVKNFKYKNILAKGYIPNWSEEVLVVNKIKNTVVKKLQEQTFYKKELQKTNQQKFRIRKVLK